VQAPGEEQTPGVPRAAVWAALLLVVVAYNVPVVVSSGYFTHDDYYLKLAAAQSTPHEVLVRPGFPFLRPIPGFLFWALERLAPGDNYLAYAAASLLLHAANSVLVFYLGRLFLPGLALPAVAALLFAAATRPYEAVVWPSANNELLGALCYLGALLWFLRFAESTRWRHGAAALFLLTLALASKESCATLAAALTLCALARPSGSEQSSGKWIVVAAGWGITAAYLALRGALVQPAHLDAVLRVHYRFGPHVALNVPMFIFRLARVNAVVAIAALVSVSLRRRPAGPRSEGARLLPGWLPVALFVVSLLPFLPWADGFDNASRYMYLPSAFFALSLAMGMQALAGWRPRWVAVAVALQLAGGWWYYQHKVAGFFSSGQARRDRAVVWELNEAAARAAAEGRDGAVVPDAVLASAGTSEIRLSEVYVSLLPPRLRAMRISFGNGSAPPRLGGGAPISASVTGSP